MEVSKYHSFLQERKKDNKEDPGNDKKVSLTLILGKVMELIVLKTFSRHMKDEKAMETYLQGFKEHESRLTNLMAPEVTGSVCEGKGVDVLCFSFNKAEHP